MTAALHSEGIVCGENRVARLMRENDIASEAVKKFKITTTDSNHDPPMAARIFKTENADAVMAPNQAREKLEEVPIGVSRSAKLNQLVDQVIEEENYIKAICKMGCSACCHVEVEITSDETEVLAHIIQSGHAIDFERLEEHAKLSLGDTR